MPGGGVSGLNGSIKYVYPQYPTAPVQPGPNTVQAAPGVQQVPTAVPAPAPGPPPPPHHPSMDHNPPIAPGINKRILIHIENPFSFCNNSDAFRKLLHNEDLFYSNVFTVMLEVIINMV